MSNTDSRFDTFWKVYPRRVGKQDALKAWHQAHVDDELLVLIIKALEWQVQTWDDIKFVPHPASWIRGRRWEDENPNQRRAGVAQTIAEVLRQMGVNRSV